jgi:3',5'-cyclic AMP phosphodiesterase CpdA
VPGNHDVPLRNIFDRFFRPLVKYRRYVCDDLEPIFVDDEIAVLGVNTARSATFKNGRINVRQISRLRTRLQDLAPGIFKVVVTHHPFDLPDPHDENDVVGRSRKAMEAFAACGVDLLLAGHMHATSAGVATHEQSGKNYSAVAVQAGTTTSVRRRNEPNSFNFIFADRSRIEIQQFVCDASGKTFSLSDTRTFIRSETGWSPTA